MTTILDLIIEEERHKREEEKFEQSLEHLYIEYPKFNVPKEKEENKSSLNVIEINLY